MRNKNPEFIKKNMVITRILGILVHAACLNPLPHPPTLLFTYLFLLHLNIDTENDWHVPQKI